MAWRLAEEGRLASIAVALFIVLPTGGLGQAGLAQPIVVPIPDSSAYRVQKNLEYRERGGRAFLMDVFTPSSGAARPPAVLFVHGGPIPESVLPQGKDLGQLQSFGPFLTSAGIAGVVFSHGLSGLDAIQEAAGDVEAAVAFVRANAETLGIDPDRLCLVFTSAGGILLAPFLRARPSWLKCVVVNYAILRPDVLGHLMGEAVSQEQQEGLDPFPHVTPPGETAPSLFIAEAGRDAAALNQDLERLTDQAVAAGWRVEYWNHPAGPHAFDVYDPSPRSRAIVMRIRAFLREQLQEAN